MINLDLVVKKINLECLYKDSYYYNECTKNDLERDNYKCDGVSMCKMCEQTFKQLAYDRQMETLPEKIDLILNEMAGLKDKMAKLTSQMENLTKTVFKS